MQPLTWRGQQQILTLAWFRTSFGANFSIPFDKHQLVAVFRVAGNSVSIVDRLIR